MSKYSFAALVACLALLPGCMNIRPYDMNPDKVQTRAHVRTLAGASDEMNDWVTQNGRFRETLKTASTAPSETGPATEYLQAGVAVSDLYCRAFFEKLGEQRGDQEALQGTFNIVDGVTAAALGFAEASADTIALTGVGFTSIEALFENLDAAYLVSPEIDQVEALVFSARDTLYTKITSDPDKITYFEAERRLAAYHQLCTFNGVKRLVNEAVASGKPILRTGTSARDQLLLAAADPVLASLSALLANSNSSLSADDAKYLFAYYSGFSEGDGVAESVLQKIGKSIEGADNAAKRKTLDDNLLTAKSILRQLDAMLGLQAPATEWVAEVRAKAAKIESLQTVLATTPVPANAVTERTAFCNSATIPSPAASEYGQAIVDMAKLTSVSDTQAAANCAGAPALLTPLSLLLAHPPPAVSTLQLAPETGLVVRIE